jgi:hypothetical protein
MKTIVAHINMSLIHFLPFSYGIDLAGSRIISPRIVGPFTVRAKDDWQAGKRQANELIYGIGLWPNSCDGKLLIDTFRLQLTIVPPPGTLL